MPPQTGFEPELGSFAGRALVVEKSHLPMLPYRNTLLLSCNEREGGHGPLGLVATLRLTASTLTGRPL